MLLKQKSYDLTEGPVRKMLVLFVLPIIAGSLFQQLYTTADAAIVGRFAGKQALAAIDAVYKRTDRWGFCQEELFRGREKLYD